MLKNHNAITAKVIVIVREMDGWEEIMPKNRAHGKRIIPNKLIESPNRIQGLP